MTYSFDTKAYRRYGIRKQLFLLLISLLIISVVAVIMLYLIDNHNILSEILKLPSSVKTALLTEICIFVLIIPIVSRFSSYIRDRKYAKRSELSVGLESDGSLLRFRTGYDTAFRIFSVTRVKHQSLGIVVHGTITAEYTRESNMGRNRTDQRASIFIPSYFSDMKMVAQYLSQFTDSPNRYF